MPAQPTFLDNSDDGDLHKPPSRGRQRTAGDDYATPDPQPTRFDSDEAAVLEDWAADSALDPHHSATLAKIRADTACIAADRADLSADSAHQSAACVRQLAYATIGFVLGLLLGFTFAVTLCVARVTREVIEITPPSLPTHVLGELHEHGSSSHGGNHPAP